MEYSEFDLERMAQNLTEHQDKFCHHLRATEVMRSMGNTLTDADRDKVTAVSRSDGNYEAMDHLITFIKKRHRALPRLLEILRRNNAQELVDLLESGIRRGTRTTVPTVTPHTRTMSTRPVPPHTSPRLGAANERSPYTGQKLREMSYTVVRTLVEHLGMNPLRNDWRSLAAKAGFQNNAVTLILRTDDPADNFFQHWMTMDECTLENIVYFLRQMRRDDVIEEIQKIVGDHAAFQQAPPPTEEASPVSAPQGATARAMATGGVDIPATIDSMVDRVERVTGLTNQRQRRGRSSDVSEPSRRDAAKEHVPEQVSGLTTFAEEADSAPNEERKRDIMDVISQDSIRQEEGFAEEADSAPIEEKKRDIMDVISQDSNRQEEGFGVEESGAQRVSGDTSAQTVMDSKRKERSPRKEDKNGAFSKNDLGNSAAPRSVDGDSRSTNIGPSELSTIDNTRQGEKILNVASWCVGRVRHTSGMGVSEDQGNTQGRAKQVEEKIVNIPTSPSNAQNIDKVTKNSQNINTSDANVNFSLKNIPANLSLSDENLADYDLETAIKEPYSIEDDISQESGETAIKSVNSEPSAEFQTAVEFGESGSCGKGDGANLNSGGSMVIYLPGKVNHLDKIRQIQELTNGNDSQSSIGMSTIDDASSARSSCKPGGNSAVTTSGHSEDLNENAKGLEVGIANRDSEASSATNRTGLELRESQTEVNQSASVSEDSQTQDLGSSAIEGNTIGLSDLERRGLVQSIQTAADLSDSYCTPHNVSHIYCPSEGDCSLHKCSLSESVNEENNTQDQDPSSQVEGSKSVSDHTSLQKGDRFVSRSNTSEMESGGNRTQDQRSLGEGDLEQSVSDDSSLPKGDFSDRKCNIGDMDPEETETPSSLLLAPHEETKLSVESTVANRFDTKASHNSVQLTMSEVCESTNPTEKSLDFSEVVGSVDNPHSHGAHLPLLRDGSVSEIGDGRADPGFGENCKTAEVAHVSEQNESQISELADLEDDPLLQRIILQSLQESQEQADTDLNRYEPQVVDTLRNPCEVEKQTDRNRSNPARMKSSESGFLEQRTECSGYDLRTSQSYPSHFTGQSHRRQLERQRHVEPASTVVEQRIEPRNPDLFDPNERRIGLEVDASETSVSDDNVFHDRMCISADGLETPPSRKKSVVTFNTDDEMPSGADVGVLRNSEDQGYRSLPCFSAIDDSAIGAKNTATARDLKQQTPLRSSSCSDIRVSADDPTSPWRSQEDDGDVGCLPKKISWLGCCTRGKLPKVTSKPFVKKTEFYKKWWRGLKDEKKKVPDQVSILDPAFVPRRCHSAGGSEASDLDEYLDSQLDLISSRLEMGTSVLDDMDVEPSIAHDSGLGTSNATMATRTLSQMSGEDVSSDDLNATPRGKKLRSLTQIFDSLPDGAACGNPDRVDSSPHWDIVWQDGTPVGSMSCLAEDNLYSSQASGAARPSQRNVHQRYSDSDQDTPNAEDIVRDRGVSIDTWYSDNIEASLSSVEEVKSPNMMLQAPSFQSTLSPIRHVQRPQEERVHSANRFVTSTPEKGKTPKSASTRERGKPRSSEFKGSGRQSRSISEGHSRDQRCPSERENTRSQGVQRRQRTISEGTVGRSAMSSEERKMGDGRSRRTQSGGRSQFARRHSCDDSDQKMDRLGVGRGVTSQKKSTSQIEPWLRPLRGNMSQGHSERKQQQRSSAPQVEERHPQSSDAGSSQSSDQSENALSNVMGLGPAISSYLRHIEKTVVALTFGAKDDKSESQDSEESSRRVSNESLPMSRPRELRDLLSNESYLENRGRERTLPCPETGLHIASEFTSSRIRKKATDSSTLGASGNKERNSSYLPESDTVKTQETDIPGHAVRVAQSQGTQRPRNESVRPKVRTNPRFFHKKSGTKTKVEGQEQTSSLTVDGNIASRHISDDLHAPARRHGRQRLGTEQRVHPLMAVASLRSFDHSQNSLHQEPAGLETSKSDTNLVAADSQNDRVSNFTQSSHSMENEPEARTVGDESKVAETRSSEASSSQSDSKVRSGNSESDQSRGSSTEADAPDQVPRRSSSIIDIGIGALRCAMTKGESTNIEIGLKLSSPSMGRLALPSESSGNLKISSEQSETVPEELDNVKHSVGEQVGQDNSQRPIEKLVAEQVAKVESEKMNPDDKESGADEVESVLEDDPNSDEDFPPPPTTPELAELGLLGTMIGVDEAELFDENSCEELYDEKNMADLESQENDTTVTPKDGLVVLHPQVETVGKVFDGKVETHTANFPPAHDMQDVSDDLVAPSSQENEVTQIEYSRSHIDGNVETMVRPDDGPDNLGSPSQGEDNLTHVDNSQNDAEGKLKTMLPSNYAEDVSDNLEDPSQGNKITRDENPQNDFKDVLPPPALSSQDTSSQSPVKSKLETDVLPPNPEDSSEEAMRHPHEGSYENQSLERRIAKFSECEPRPMEALVSGQAVMNETSELVELPDFVQDVQSVTLDPDVNNNLEDEHRKDLASATQGSEALGDLTDGAQELSGLPSQGSQEERAEEQYLGTGQSLEPEAQGPPSAGERHEEVAADVSEEIGTGHFSSYEPEVPSSLTKERRGHEEAVSDVSEKIGHLSFWPPEAPSSPAIETKAHEEALSDAPEEIGNIPSHEPKVPILVATESSGHEEAVSGVSKEIRNSSSPEQEVPDSLDVESRGHEEGNEGDMGTSQDEEMNESEQSSESVSAMEVSGSENDNDAEQVSVTSESSTGAIEIDSDDQRPDTADTSSEAAQVSAHTSHEVRFTSDALVTEEANIVEEDVAKSGTSQDIGLQDGPKDLPEDEASNENVQIEQPSIMNPAGDNLVEKASEQESSSGEELVESGAGAFGKSAEVEGMSDLAIEEMVERPQDKKSLSEENEPKVEEDYQQDNLPTTTESEQKRHLGDEFVQSGEVVDGTSDLAIEIEVAERADDQAESPGTDEHNVEGTRPEMIVEEDHQQDTSPLAIESEQERPLHEEIVESGADVFGNSAEMETMSDIAIEETAEGGEEKQAESPSASGHETVNEETDVEPRDKEEHQQDNLPTAVEFVQEKPLEDEFVESDLSVEETAEDGEEQQEESPSAGRHEIVNEGMDVEPRDKEDHQQDNLPAAIEFVQEKPLEEEFVESDLSIEEMAEDGEELQAESPSAGGYEIVNEGTDDEPNDKEDHQHDNLPNAVESEQERPLDKEFVESDLTTVVTTEGEEEQAESPSTDKREIENVEGTGADPSNKVSHQQDKLPTALESKTYLEFHESLSLPDIVVLSASSSSEETFAADQVAGPASLPDIIAFTGQFSSDSETEKSQSNLGTVAKGPSEVSEMDGVDSPKQLPRVQDVKNNDEGELPTDLANKEKFHVRFEDDPSKPLGPQAADENVTDKEETIDTTDNNFEPKLTKVLVPMDQKFKDTRATTESEVGTSADRNLETDLQDKMPQPITTVDNLSGKDEEDRSTLLLRTSVVPKDQIPADAFDKVDALPEVERRTESLEGESWPNMTEESEENEQGAAGTVSDQEGQDFEEHRESPPVALANLSTESEKSLGRSVEETRSKKADENKEFCELGPLPVDENETDAASKAPVELKQENYGLELLPAEPVSLKADVREEIYQWDSLPVGRDVGVPAPEIQDQIPMGSLETGSSEKKETENSLHMQREQENESEESTGFDSKDTESTWPNFEQQSLAHRREEGSVQNKIEQGKESEEDIVSESSNSSQEIPQSPVRQTNIEGSSQENVDISVTTGAGVYELPVQDTSTELTPSPVRQKIDKRPVPSQFQEIVNVSMPYGVNMKEFPFGDSGTGHMSWPQSPVREKVEISGQTQSQQNIDVSTHTRMFGAGVGHLSLGATDVMDRDQSEQSPLVEETQSPRTQPVSFAEFQKVISELDPSSEYRIPDVQSEIASLPNFGEEEWEICRSIVDEIFNKAMDFIEEREMRIFSAFGLAQRPRSMFVTAAGMGRGPSAVGAGVMMPGAQNRLLPSPDKDKVLSDISEIEEESQLVCTGGASNVPEQAISEEISEGEKGLIVKSVDLCKKFVPYAAGTATFGTLAYLMYSKMKRF